MSVPIAKQGSPARALHRHRLLDAVSRRPVRIDDVHTAAEPFRDDPIVWHGFSFFTAVIVFFSSRRDAFRRPRTALASALIVVQTLDVPRLVRVAEHEGARIHLCVVPGETIFDQSRVAVVVGGPNLPDAEILKALRLGPERTFDQDPALALRLLADIALRALSPAVNDPTTAVQALDAIADLLRLLVARDLGVEVVDGADRTPRVVLKLPSWEDYVSVGLDEIIDSGLNSVQVGRRLGRLLDDPLAIAPPQHREPIERRLATMFRIPLTQPRRRRVGWTHSIRRSGCCHGCCHARPSCDPSASGSRSVSRAGAPAGPGARGCHD